MPKPLGDKYIAIPSTLGQKIRNRRLELGVLQKDVADILHTSVDTITNWENGNTSPQISFYPSIISFLGYFPFNITQETTGGIIKAYRFRKGLSIKNLAKNWQIDEKSLLAYELNKREPSKKLQQKIVHFCQA